MRHILLYRGLGLVLLATLGSCSKGYDDSALKSRVETIDKRITSLGARLKGYNEELVALEQLLQSGRYVKELKEVRHQDKLVAYELKMSDDKILYLPVGEKGRAGRGITMGVQQDPGDLKYYWTVDSEWLLDSRGNRVALHHTDQPEGIKGFTPKLRIHQYAWQIQVREGEWTRLDYPIVGPEGDTGDILPSLIQSITPAADDWFYELRLTDGTVLHLPRKSPEARILITNPARDNRQAALENGRVHRLPFTIQNPYPGMIVELSPTSKGFGLRLVWTNAEKTEGYLEIEPLMYTASIGDVWAVGYQVYFLRGNRELISSLPLGQFYIKKVVDE